MTSLLIDGMPRLCHGLQFTDPGQQLEYTATVSMFVDDASNSTNNFRSWLHQALNLDELVEMTRHDSQTWERFLWTFGGLLNLVKCAYYILAWNFDAEGRASYVTEPEIPVLRLTSGNNLDAAPVKLLNFDETHTYLGNHLATGMLVSDAYTALTKTATTFSSRLLCSDLSKRDMRAAYFAVFVPSMAYTLPVSHHAPKTLRKLQWPATRDLIATQPIE
jgi:hypothetical protein